MSVRIDELQVRIKQLPLESDNTFKQEVSDVLYELAVALLSVKEDSDNTRFRIAKIDGEGAE